MVLGPMSMHVLELEKIHHVEKDKIRKDVHVLLEQDLVSHAPMEK